MVRRSEQKRLMAAMMVVAAFWGLVGASALSADPLVWPPAPDTARIEYLGSLECRDLEPAGGFFSKITRWVGGRSEDEMLSLPFDVVASGSSLFMICQGTPALIEVERANGKFKLYRNKKRPMHQPISLCDGGQNIIFVTDPDGGAVYMFKDEKLTPFITAELVRSTGLAALPDSRRLFIVDTGDHSLKIFDYGGNLLRTVTTDSTGGPMFNYPTFATAVGDDQILVNDGLNYQIKRFDRMGNLTGAFGREGDGPGAFSRPKGIAVDSDFHIYVVDNLFDNLQVFDKSGHVLLALGSGGDAAGQFWSPTGIDISGDTIFIADTYNHRVQIFHYLGGTP